MVNHPFDQCICSVCYLLFRLLVATPVIRLTAAMLHYLCSRNHCLGEEKTPKARCWELECSRKKSYNAPFQLKEAHSLLIMKNSRAEFANIYHKEKT